MNNGSMPRDETIPALVPYPYKFRTEIVDASAAMRP